LGYADPFLNPANVSLNLVTFGSPPILSRNINSQLTALLRPSSVFLAFAIEGDPVVKLDMAYMKFLAASLKLTRPFSSNQEQQEQFLPPPMPPLTVHSVGDIIVFQNTTDGRDGRNVRIFKAEENILRRVAWVNLTVHFMHQYMAFVDAAPALRVGLS
jgi:hypothetical protein